MKLAPLAAALALSLAACNQAVGNAQAPSTPSLMATPAPSPKVSNAPPPSPGPSPTVSNAPAPSQAPLPGGYSSQDPSTTESQAIMREAEKLVQAKHPTRNFKLIQLASIQSQVVAGTNFRLNATYTDVSGSGSVNLVVFRSLQNEFSLSESDYQAAP